MTNVTATANTLVGDYTSGNTYIGLATGNPGSAAAPANEASGGSPAYARVATTWGSASNGVITGSQVTIHVPAATYNYMIVCSGSSGSNMVDWCAIPPQVIASQSTVTITPTATAS